MTTESKKDVYGIVSDTIIKVMESGIVPWRMPWGVGGIPRNALTLKPYRGVNVPLLAMYSFEQNVFVSEKQLTNLGGKAKEGEYPMIATYWEWRVDKEDSEKQYSVLLYERVFNISQCEGVSFEDMEPHSYPEKPLTFCHDLVKGIINSSSLTPKLMKADSSMRYDVDTDVIFMPESKEYNSSERYYYDLFQMLVHASGIPARLNRECFMDMGERFSKEDLIADMGAHYLCFYAGMSESVSSMSVSHLYKWLELFREDTRLFVSACTMAQKVVDFILSGFVMENGDDDTSQEEEYG
jgi:antirestriction protein ArdC